MGPSRAPSVLLLHSLRSVAIEQPLSTAAGRTFSSTRSTCQEVEVQKPSYYHNPDPATVHVPRLERKLMRSGQFPIGSRRRRAALSQSPGVPFDELPYQCFQEARKILIADRAEKLKKIETERARIGRLQDVDPNTFPGGEMYKQRRLNSMMAELEKLKILADVNDPNVKRRFEDGNGAQRPLRRRFQANNHRRSKQTHLQTLSRAKMARISSESPGPTHHTDEGHSRRDP